MRPTSCRREYRPYTNNLVTKPTCILSTTISVDSTISFLLLLPSLASLWGEAWGETNHWIGDFHNTQDISIFSHRIKSQIRFLDSRKTRTIELVNSTIDWVSCCGREATRSHAVNSIWNGDWWVAKWQWMFDLRETRDFIFNCGNMVEYFRLILFTYFLQLIRILVMIEFECDSRLQ